MHELGSDGSSVLIIEIMSALLSTYRNMFLDIGEEVQKEHTHFQTPIVACACINKKELFSE